MAIRAGLSIIVATWICGCSPAETAPRSPATPVRVFSKASINEEVDRHREAFLACYESLLNQDPRAEGNISVDLFIGEDGRVFGAAFSDGNLREPVMVECVLKACRQLQLPPPVTGKMQLHYTMHFDTTVWQAHARWPTPKPPACRSDALVREAVRTRIDDFVDCANLARAHLGGASAQVVVQFTIEPSGAVSRAIAVRSTTSDPEIIECVVAPFWRLQLGECDDHPLNEPMSVTLNPAKSCAAPDFPCVEINKWPAEPAPSRL